MTNMSPPNRGLGLELGMDLRRCCGDLISNVF